MARKKGKKGKVAVENGLSSVAKRLKKDGFEVATIGANANAGGAAGTNATGGATGANATNATGRATGANATNAAGGAAGANTKNAAGASVVGKSDLQDADAVIVSGKNKGVMNAAKNAKGQVINAQGMSANKVRSQIKNKLGK
ncbi:Uncharacterized protein family (UPF0180) [Halobacteroides halobius DSM 5150]|uniref:Uncharacterized protein family (UPF0180) n=1 Tax=Halobacteroides halobius (strain ATCC 35273 / DSM 5150 / MD-1) TaxID=748449 RepID=L0KCV2_HALHC|nr:YkuS family protein [Halobacteroides halobius]AGB41903.1 Uncharacterized protein family (UPF0180) [Halobacteroides halobius DSM 5150]